MNDRYIGVLWEGKGKNCNYLKGNVEIDGKKEKIIIFKNGNKTKDSQPDYSILLQQDKPQEKKANSRDEEWPFS